MIQIEPRGSVTILRLDRPAKKNAQTPEMLAALADAVHRAEFAHAIVLSGVGDTFCAGFDLSLAQNDDSVLPALLNALSRAVMALRDAPCPVIASAHGGAIAGGCALLCGCDFVVTDDNARIGYPAVKLGISPAVSGVHLAAGVGFGPARTRMLDPGVVNGRDALRLGIASHLVSTPAECEPKAVEIATNLAAKPPHALSHTKRWLNQLDGSLHPDHLAASLDASLSGVGSPEQRSLLAAIWNKK